jgi:hypothetical protein
MARIWAFRAARVNRPALRCKHAATPSPAGDKRPPTSPSRSGLRAEARERAARRRHAPIRRGATCVDEALNNVSYGQAYPEIVPQLSVALPRLVDCMTATQAPACCPAMRGGFGGFAVCSSRRVSNGLGPGLPGHAGDPREGLSVLAAVDLGRTTLRERRALRGARAHAAYSRASAARPDGRRFGRGAPAPHRHGRPGWVLRSTRDDEEASGSAARLCRSVCFGRKSVGPDQGTCAAAAAAVESLATGSAAGPLTPLAICGGRSGTLGPPIALAAPQSPAVQCGIAFRITIGEQIACPCSCAVWRWL